MGILCCVLLLLFGATPQFLLLCQLKSCLFAHKLLSKLHSNSLDLDSSSHCSPRKLALMNYAPARCFSFLQRADVINASDRSGQSKLMGLISEP